MSEETKTEPAPISLGDTLEYYKSLKMDNREQERDLLERALDNGVFPASMRYDVFRGGYRGVIKGIDGEDYYFTLPAKGVYHIVKATDDTKKWEVQRLYKGLSSGCDLIKSKDDEIDEEENTDKAVAPGGAGELPPAGVPEEQSVAAQNAEITQTHPGGAMGTTPESDSSVSRWHGTPGIQRALPEIDHTVKHQAWTGADLLKAYGQHLQETAPRLNQVDPQMKQFMVEVMGKMPDEVDAGHVKLNSLQRAEFNRWLTKSLRGRMSGLTDWLKKGQ